MNKRRKILLGVSLILANICRAQVVRRIPSDPTERRIRGALTGRINLNDRYSLEIEYLEDLDSFIAKLLSNNITVGTVNLSEGDCIRKVVCRENQCLVLVDSQEDWAAYWTRGLMVLDFATKDFCDVRWLAVSEPRTDNTIVDIAIARKVGFCFRCLVVPRKNGIDGTETVRKDGWYSIVGVQRNLQSSEPIRIDAPNFLTAEDGVFGFEAKGYHPPK